MTTEDPGRETEIVPVHGRNIVVRELLDAQMALLMRESEILRRNDVEVTRKVRGVSLMFKVLLSAAVQEEDRDYLEELIAEGGLELKDLMAFVAAFRNEEDMKPKVRRGRSPVKRA